jgi:hypothetical protein
VSSIESAQQTAIRVMLAADSAQAVNGKLYVLGGGFDRITLPPGAPLQFRFDLAMVIEVPWTATNHPIHVTVDLLDADGQPIGYHAEGQLETGRPPGARHGASFPVPLVFPVLAEFPAPGRYTISGSIDGEESDRVSLEVAGSPPV